MKNLIEAIKAANKKEIIKKVFICGGSAIALAVVLKLVGGEDAFDDDDCYDVELTVLDTDEPEEQASNEE